MANSCCGSGSGSFPDANTLRLIARNNAIVYTEIAEIQKAIFDAINTCEFDPATGQPIQTEPSSCVVIKDGTPMTWNSGIGEVTIVDGGSDYFPVVATASFVHPTGTGAQAEVVVVNGSITEINVINGGINYNIIYPTLDLSVLGGTGGDIHLDVDPTDGSITNAVIINGGTGYVDGLAPVIQNGGSGSGAVINIITTGGVITGVDIVDGGLGYFPVVPLVDIQHPTGQGFDGTVLVDATGVITGVAVNSGGILYGDLLPQLDVIDLGGSGHGAQLVPTVDDVTGSITSVNIENSGFGYSNNVIVDVIPAPTSSGNGAQITATVNSNPYNTNVINYYYAVSGNDVDCYYTDQIDQVLCYFRNLGYTIDVRINPDTDGSIMWVVCWC